jgi:hypothetical protein
MPEVAGDAALLIDPASTEDIRHGLEVLAFDSSSMPTPDAVQDARASMPSADVAIEEATKEIISTPPAIVPPAAPAQLPNPKVAAVPAPIVALPDAVLPPSPEPSMASTIEAQVRDEEIVILLGDRRYRIRGLTKTLAFDVLLNVKSTQQEISASNHKTP